MKDLPRSQQAHFAACACAPIRACLQAKCTVEKDMKTQLTITVKDTLR